MVNFLLSLAVLSSVHTVTQYTISNNVWFHEFSYACSHRQRLKLSCQIVENFCQVVMMGASRMMRNNATNCNKLCMLVQEHQQWQCDACECMYWYASTHRHSKKRKKMIHGRGKDGAFISD